VATGRIRKEIDYGWNPLVDTQFDNLKMGVLRLKPGDNHELQTGESEYGCLLVSGDCDLTDGQGDSRPFGPRPDPFEHKPYALLLSRERSARFTAKEESLLVVASSPAENSYQDCYMTPDDVRQYQRGSDNWSRSVRFVLWADNTEGNQLLMGETVVPSGNWGTVPPHRHDSFIEEEEVPYNEVYYFQFSRPEGFGLIWQFSDDLSMDQAFSLRSGDAAFLGEGYHPVACGPGSTLYQLTAMAGPHRVSRSRLHDDFVFLTQEKNMANPYKNQR
jgi:5-deoxy-glucuronate isomerase